MPHIDEVAYSRDDCISAIRDYYAFLTKLYLNSEKMTEPPTGVWPSTTTYNLRALGKTDDVIDLLRHLPYMDQSQDYLQAHGSAHAVFADWNKIAKWLSQMFYEEAVE
jgi:hypothetical protein